MKLLALLSILMLGSLYAEEPQLPKEAITLLPSAFNTPKQVKPEWGRIEKLSGSDAFKAEGFRASSTQKLEKPYELSLSKSFTLPIAKGQTCMFVVRARTLESEQESGSGKITCSVQNTKDYKSLVLWRTQAIGKEWDTIFFAFTAGNDVPEGAGSARVAIGEQKQVIEVADIQLYRFPIGFDIFEAPQMKKTYEGREQTSPWRIQAESRIEKLRKGELNILVKGAEGNPVEGAKVTIHMKRHLFGFGTSVDVNLLSGLDLKTPTEDQKKYLNTVDELFSRVVCENGMRVGNQEGELNPSKPWVTDARLRAKSAVQWTLQWAKDRKMSSRGHYLTWCYLEPWAQEEVNRGGALGLMARYEKHWAYSIPFAEPYVEEWDALNHPVPFVEADALYNVVGPNIYAEVYAKIRTQTSKKLFVNEDTFSPERSAGFERHIKHMIAQGQTPDGCGFQSHFVDSSIPSMEEEWQNYERFGSMVRLLTVTEYDLQTLDDQLQADHLRDMLTLCFSHPQMTGFVIWGFWEKRHWKPTAALFKADWSERPAVKVWRDLVKGKWWTNACLDTTSEGSATVPAYFGWYEVEVEKGGKSKKFEVKHATGGSKIVLKME